MTASRLLAVALVVSLAANVALLLTRNSSPERNVCADVAQALDFYIEGLEKGNDPLYSPIIPRGLEPGLLACRPEMADELEPQLAFLRGELAKLSIAGAAPAARAKARAAALEEFRRLRASTAP